MIGKLRELIAGLVGSLVSALGRLGDERVSALTCPAHANSHGRRT